MTHKSQLVNIANMVISVEEQIAYFNVQRHIHNTVKYLRWRFLFENIKHFPKTSNKNSDLLPVGHHAKMHITLVDLNCYSEQISAISDQAITQLTCSCSKSTIQTLEKGVKYVQS